MATGTLQHPSFHMTADSSSFHQVSMAAAAAGSAAAAQASSYPHHTTSMMPSNPYFSHQQQHHPYYSPYFHPSQPEYGNSTLLDPYHGDFRPTFYNPFEIKHRRRTSRAQLKILEKSFTENAKPNASVRRYLAQELDMTPRGVQIWFQNRRAKAKLQKRKSQINATAPIVDAAATTNTTTFLMTPMSSSASTTSSSSSCLLSTPSTSSTFVPSPTSAGSLFYPMDEIRSVATEAAAQSMLMADQAWMVMPMHPLKQESSLHGDDIQRRQSCPLLSNESSLWDQSVLQQQTRRASDYPTSSPSNTLNNHGLGWMDAADENSCSGSSNSCDTPRWTTPTQYTAQQYSPLDDHSILDLCQQQQQQQQQHQHQQHQPDCAYAPPASTISALDFDPSIPSLMSCLL